jgi:hypothetical protein
LQDASSGILSNHKLQSIFISKGNIFLLLVVVTVAVQQNVPMFSTALGRIDNGISVLAADG